MAEDTKFTQDEIMALFSTVLPAPGAAPAAPPPPPPPPAAAAPVPAPVAPPPPPPVAPPPVAPPPILPVAPVAPPAAIAVPPPPPPVTLPPPPPPVTAPPPDALSAPAPAPAAAPAGAAVSKEDLALVDDLGHQFEIGRVRMEQVLTPFLSEKVTRKLLAWSLERVQKAHPIFKNVHWGTNGELLENGGIEVSMFVKNAQAMPGQPVVALAKAALLDLLKTRLAAVEQGLGAAMRQAVEKEVTRLGAMLQ